MSNKKFKSLTGYVQSVSPVAEGKKLHNYASIDFQVDSNSVERILFFFLKPAKTSHAFNTINRFADKDVAVAITGLTENDDGEYLASKTTSVRPKAVAFAHSRVEDEYLPIDNLPLELFDDQATVNIRGTVVHTTQISSVKKFDQASQKRIPVIQQRFILTDMTGAVIVFTWGNLAGKVENGKSYELINVRPSVDPQGEAYIQTTFKTDIKSCAHIPFDEDSANVKNNVQIQREKIIKGNVSSCNVALIVICPKCKAKSNSTNLIITCDKCNSSFRSKNVSLKVELTVEKKDSTEQHHLIVYKDELCDVIPEPDTTKVNSFFLTDDMFEFTITARSGNVNSFKKIQ